MFPIFATMSKMSLLLHSLFLAALTTMLSFSSAAVLLNHPMKHSHPHLATLLPRSIAENGGFTHAAYLDMNNAVLLRWSANSIMSTSADKPDVLVAELSAPTRGWISFGVSPNGGMVGANMLVMWVDSQTGSVHVQDRYATAFAEPHINDDQTAAVVAFEGYENATHTVVEFARWLNAGCRSKNDTTITATSFGGIPHGRNTQDSAVRVIFAYGNQDPDADGHIKYHGTENRGSQSLYLIDDVNGSYEHDKTAAQAQTTEIATFTATNYSVPALDTYYHCEIFELPENDNDVHIVGFEPILQHSNLDILHHFLIHDCAATFNEPPKIRSFECYNTPPELLGPQIIDCFNSIIWGWAVGGQATYMPQNVGLPLKASKGVKRYLLMETHYNNPALIAGRIDSSGFRMLITNKLRPTRASTLLVAAPVDVAVTVPGSTPSFTVPVLCAEQCTQKFLPTQGATAFSVLLHSHLLGRSLALRHFRDGSELTAIASDPTYDFNYQQWRPINVTVLPGDKFVLECNYSSTTPELRKNSTVGGFSTRDEMCLAIVFLTPEVELKSCMSSLDFAREKVVLKFDDIPSPPANATFEQRTKYQTAVKNRVKAIDWPSNAHMQSQLSDLYLNQPHTWHCSSVDDGRLNGKDRLMPSWAPYGPPNVCLNAFV